jgi:hypothetical protein
MSTRNYARFSLPTIHESVRTVSLADPASAPEFGRFVTVTGAYPGAGQFIFGSTIHEREVGVSPFLPAPSVPGVATQAYAVGARFTLTAPQAANVGGRAGIYQVRTAFTPAAVTLTANEGANVFYIGAALQPNVRTQQGQTSTTPVFPAFDTSNYQRNIAVCTQGMVVVEAGAAVAVGANVDSDTSGRAITAAGTRIRGVALTAAAQAGDFINVELI